MTRHETQEMLVLGTVAIFYAAGLAFMSYVAVNEPLPAAPAELPSQDQSAN